MKLIKEKCFPLQVAAIEEAPSSYILFFQPERFESSQASKTLQNKTLNNKEVSSDRTFALLTSMQACFMQLNEDYHCTIKV